jgi:hypothetical protein
MWATLPLLLLGLAPQDDPARERALVFGMVRARDGSPWVGAEVELVSAPGAEGICADLAERLAATTDARGRFRVDASPGRAYRVWAHGPLDGPTYRATVPQALAFPGTPLVLDEDRPGQRAELSFSGLDRWRAHAPWTVRVEVRDAAFVAVLPLGSDPSKSVTMPALPGASATVSLLDARGLRLAGCEVARDSAGAALAVEPAVSVLVRARIKASGDAAAGALFAYQDGPATVALGPLGADGSGRFELPADGLTSWAYRVLCGGCAPGVLRQLGAPPEGDPAAAELMDGGGRVWTGRLLPGSTLRARLALGGEPAAGWPLLVATAAECEVEDNSHFLAASSRLLRTGADGSIEVPNLHRGQGGTVRVVIPPAAATLLPPAWRSAWPTSFLGLRQPMKGPLRDLGELDLRAAWWLARLTVVGHDGVPAADAVIRIGAPSGGDPAHWLEVAADRRGRANVLLPRADLTFVGRAGDAWSLDRFQVGGAGRDAAFDLSLTLDPPAVLVCRVVGNDGKPVERAMVYAHVDGEVGLLREPQDVAVEGEGLVLRSRVCDPEALSSVLSTWVLNTSWATDVGGEVRVALPRMAASLQVHAILNGVRASKHNLPFDAREASNVVEIVLPAGG